MTSLGLTFQAGPLEFSFLNFDFRSREMEWSLPDLWLFIQKYQTCYSKVFWTRLFTAVDIRLQQSKVTVTIISISSSKNLFRVDVMCHSWGACFVSRGSTVWASLHPGCPIGSVCHVALSIRWFFRSSDFLARFCKNTTLYFTLNSKSKLFTSN